MNEVLYVSPGWVSSYPLFPWKSKQSWCSTAAWGVCLTLCVANCKLAASSFISHSTLTCFTEYIQVWFAERRNPQWNVLTMLWNHEFSTKQSTGIILIAKWCSRKTQNLKMKELVSTAAVSFRHARAQVFSFWPFLSIFTWIRLMMNQCPSFAPIILSTQEVCIDFFF